MNRIPNPTTPMACEHGVEYPTTCKPCDDYAAFKRIVAEIIDAERGRVEDAKRRLEEFYMTAATRGV